MAKPEGIVSGGMTTVEESYAHAERLTRAQKTTFYHTFRFLTPPRRRAIYAVYAYSRRLDDAVDAVEEKAVPPEDARRELAFLASFLDEDSAYRLVGSIFYPGEEVFAGLYVVHREHGIARFEGVRKQSRSGEDDASVEEFLVLEFAQGARLLIPASGIDDVHRYIGAVKGAPDRSILGG